MTNLTKENERLYRTDAIVLRRMNVGEADKILTVYTPYRGKLRLVAKGVRRTTSRLGGYVELFTHARFLVAKGRNLDLVTQSEPINVFRKLREDLNLFAHASYAAELLDRLTEEGMENHPAYELLVATLKALDEGQDANMIMRDYELHLLDFMGYRPQLQQCVRCTNELRPVVNYFSPELGGVLCDNCGKIERRSVELSVDALKVLRYLQRTPFAGGARLRMSEQLRRELEQVMRSYTRYLLERDLKSAEFIHTIS
ncbi:MAG TPA: DNA repair protein RecO [Chloroflexia bacterium]|nr:DNA repair protein RecO [Chloroflexia bacterium]